MRGSSHECANIEKNGVSAGAQMRSRRNIQRHRRAVGANMSGDGTKVGAVAVVAIAVVVCVLALRAQDRPAELPAPAIRVSTHYVLVDAIVTNANGNPVRDLKPDEITIKESGKKQKIDSFELLNGNASPAPAQALPPNVYSNKPAYRGLPTTQTILLLDSLNTPAQNQAYVREQMLRYAANQLQPGKKVAVYALSTRLLRMQDFTDDPLLLRRALENFRVQQVAGGAQQPMPAEHMDPAAATGGSLGLKSGEGMSRIQQLQSTMQAFAGDPTPALQGRIEDTLQALRALARVAGGQRVRTNLVWISGGFPFSFSPDEGRATAFATRVNDPTGPPPLPNENDPALYNAQLQNTYMPEVRRTAALMSEVQIAVYPVDARGLFSGSLADASQSGLNQAGLLQMGQEYAQNVTSSLGAIGDSQQNMRELARQTGGEAFVNRNDIDNAVALAGKDGSTYYEIGYASSNKKFNGDYRSIKMEVSRPGLKVRHRLGYFAIDPAKDRKQLDAEVLAEIRNPALQPALVHFSVQVPPPAPAQKAKIQVNFLVDTATVNAPEVGEGKRQLKMDFYVMAFDSRGALKGSTGKTVDTALSAEDFAKASQQGLFLPIEFELPPGDYDLRLAVRDNETGYFGALTAPLKVPAPAKTGS